jgi:hypothetical protein
LHENCAVYDVVTAEWFSQSSHIAARLQLKTLAMNFLCGTRTFWLPDQPKVTEYGHVAFISRSVAIFGQQGTIKEAPRGAASLDCRFGAGGIF